LIRCHAARRKGAITIAGGRAPRKLRVPKIAGPKIGGPMSIPTKLDHCVIHISDWERSNAFYVGVLGAELVARPVGYAYRFGDKQLNVHGPGVRPAEVARIPVAPGNSDLCFEWSGPIADAIAHLQRCGVAIENGPMQRFGAKGAGTSVYFRDPDGSLMEFMSYA
jgi:catechol 2,3-dioxygenase-like lactoylglutathione lyase family enzyme